MIKIIISNESADKSDYNSFLSRFEAVLKKHENCLLCMVIDGKPFSSSASPRKHAHINEYETGYASTTTAGINVLDICSVIASAAGGISVSSQH